MKTMRAVLVAGVVVLMAGCKPKSAPRIAELESRVAALEESSENRRKKILDAMNMTKQLASNTDAAIQGLLRVNSNILQGAKIVAEQSQGNSEWIRALTNRAAAQRVPAR
jgi:hypothetical protein